MLYNETRGWHTFTWWIFYSAPTPTDTHATQQSQFAESGTLWRQKLKGIVLAAFLHLHLQGLVQLKSQASHCLGKEDKD